METKQEKLQEARVWRTDDICSTARHINTYLEVTIKTLDKAANRKDVSDIKYRLQMLKAEINRQEKSIDNDLAEIEKIKYAESWID